MNNATFQYVEDYIEFIAGYRNAAGKALGLFDTVPSPLSLARYDVKILDSLADQTCIMNLAYTDRQAELAKKIIRTYRRQLSQLNPPIHVPEDLNNFRLGVRILNRSKIAELTKGHITLRFPYDVELINLIKTQARQGDGEVVFDHENKIWLLALTESNLNWLFAVTPKFQIEIVDELKDLYHQLLAVEENGYSISLVETDEGFAITNASSSLIDYVNNHLGGFGPDNFLKLADNAPVLGYEISEPLIEKFSDIAKNRMVTQRRINFAAGKVTLEDIVEYARTVNRLPVYVYETGTPKEDTEDVKYLNRSKDLSIRPKLIVSKSEFMIGTKKQGWITNAEKIFYIK